MFEANYRKKKQMINYKIQSRIFRNHQREITVQSKTLEARSESFKI